VCEAASRTGIREKIEPRNRPPPKLERGSRVDTTTERSETVTAFSQDAEAPVEAANAARGLTEGTEPEPHPGAATPDQAGVDSPFVPDLSGIGPEVASVLQSAHAAADEMRATAHRDAEQIRAEAESAAGKMVADAQREAKALRRELHQLREDADIHCKAVREDAEGYAAEARYTAEEEVNRKSAEADQVLRAARAEAKRIVKEATSEGHRRKAALEADAARFEERFANILTIFRGISGQLEDVMRTGARPEAQVEDADKPGLQQESLEESLKPAAKAKTDRSGSRRH
jgi:cell division septum initiation protein DivIVA